MAEEYTPTAEDALAELRHNATHLDSAMTSSGFDAALAAHDTQVILDYMRTKEQPSIRIENPEDVLPFIQRALADAWDAGAKYGTYRTSRGEAVIYDLDNPHRTQTKEKRPRTRDILLAPSDPRQDAADLAAAAEPPEPYPGKPYPADVERLAEIAGVLAEVVKGGRDNVPIADLRVAAEVMAAAASGRLLPDPKAGCSCGEGTLEDYGMGLTQWFPEYDAACPEHSGNLYDPRTGVWILRPVPTTSESKEQS